MGLKLKGYSSLPNTVYPSKLDPSLYVGPPNYSSSEEAESKSLSMDVMGTYMKVINPTYNHDPKSIGLGANLKTNFYPFFDATS